MDDHDILASLDATGRLRELFKAQKWSDASSFCDRRAKKGDSQDALQICRIIALLLDQQSGKVNSSKQELGHLLTQERPVTDAATLFLLESLFQTCAKDSIIADSLAHAWERAAAVASSKHVWLYQEWFEVKFRNACYKDAKQAAMAWMKAYPQQREPFYLYILVNFVISKSNNALQTDRKLCQMLAYKALEKAAAETKGNDKQLGKTSGRVLHLPEDLLLLLRVYKDQGKIQEALDILQAESKGLISTVGQNSWEIVLQLLELCGLDGLWDRQMRSSQAILLNSFEAKSPGERPNLEPDFEERGDDWTVWKHFVVGAVHSKSGLAAFESIAGRQRRPMTLHASRNVMLASLMFYSRAEENDSKAKLLQKCLDYSKTHLTRISCFQDLQPYLGHLPRNDQEALVAKIDDELKSHRPTKTSPKSAQLKHILAEINSLKIDFNLIASQSNNPGRPSMWSALGSTCMRLYAAYLLIEEALVPTDRGAADDAVIMAAMSFLTIYRLGDNLAIIKSIVVLEYLISMSKHNYDALIILVRLYLHLGATSLAISRYSRLSIKHTQHASFSWILFSRLSTLHPWPAKISNPGASTVIYDPLDEARQALKWHQAAGTLLGKTMSRMIGNEQLTMMLGLLETQGALQNGTARAILNIECHRMQRMRSWRQAEGWSSPLALPPAIEDNRDRLPFPNYHASNRPTFEEHIPGPSPVAAPNTFWLAREYKLASLWDLMDDRQWTSIEMRRLEDMRAQSETDGVDTLTACESQADVILDQLQEAVTVSQNWSSNLSSESALNEQMEEIVKKLDGVLSLLKNSGSGASSTDNEDGFSGDSFVPLWTEIHDNYTALEIAQFVVKGIDCMKQNTRLAFPAKQSEVEERLGTAKHMCEQIRKSVLAYAESWRPSMTDVGLKHIVRQGKSAPVKLQGDRTAIDLVEVVGDDFANSVCTILRESQLEVMDGLRRSASRP